jgi:hypothetical protein
MDIESKADKAMIPSRKEVRDALEKKLASMTEKNQTLMLSPLRAMENPPCTPILKE